MIYAQQSANNYDLWRKRLCSTEIPGFDTAGKFVMSIAFPTPDPMLNIPLNQFSKSIIIIPGCMRFHLLVCVALYSTLHRPAN